MFTSSLDNFDINPLLNLGNVTFRSSERHTGGHRFKFEHFGSNTLNDFHGFTGLTYMGLSANCLLSINSSFPRHFRLDNGNNKVSCIKTNPSFGQLNFTRCVCVRLRAHLCSLIYSIIYYIIYIYISH